MTLLEYCKECKNPQPPDDDEKTLHYDWCKYHNIKTCVACEELLEREEYEELAKVKKAKKRP